jgi:hypothetical protein
MREAQLDALIFGGGIAGLWTLARLTREGYHTLLLTDAALGAGQTIASQGIIHGGVKYTLGLAEASDASRAIAEMPGVWSACLAGRGGEGELDLRAAKVLTPSQYLWTTPGLASRIAGFGASKAIRTAVDKLSPDQRPELLRDGPRGIAGIEVYRVGEPVLDVRSVVAAIAGPLQDRIARVQFPSGVRFDLSDPTGPGEVRGLRAVEILGSGDSAGLRLVPKRTILMAGQGNEGLIQIASGGGPAVFTQRRPLHMVMMRDAPGPLFGHCLGASTVPRLTISSMGRGDGEWVWYIGGQIAETGVDRSESEQIRFARDELRACLSWLDLSRARFATLRIDRAEPLTEKRTRPDGPVLFEYQNIMVGWPTKLAFAPALAGKVVEAMRASGIHPDANAASKWVRPAALADAPIANFPWDEPSLAWSKP